MLEQRRDRTLAARKELRHITVRYSTIRLVRFVNATASAIPHVAVDLIEEDCIQADSLAADIAVS